MKIAKTNKNRYVLFLTAIGILLAVLMIYTIGISVAARPSDTDPAITGCASQTPKNYTSFVATDFSMINVGVDSTSKYIVLNTGNQAIDPNNIVIPFTQDVSVTFIYEGAGYTKSDFGWFLATDVNTADGTLNADGTANFDALLAKGKIREIYFDVNDNNTNFNTGNGVLDKSASDTSDRYGDTNGDGDVNVLDNKVQLLAQKFEAGSEIVFYLKVDDQTCNGAPCVFYTKTAWNPDFYDSCRDDRNATTAYTRTFNLGDAGGESFNLSSGWMSQTAIDRLTNSFGVTLTGSKTVTYQRGQKHPHVLVGAPPNDPNQWILGWDDQKGCTPAYRVGEKLCGANGKTACTNSDCDTQECRADFDSNDLVFRINRKTGGTAALTPAQAIKPTDTAAYFTGVTIEVYDDMPCPGDTDIAYSVSPDNGTNWTPIITWDEVYVNPSAPSGKTVGSAVSNWTPGKPQYTMRRARVDFASSGRVGQAFLWKAEMSSGSDACVPKIMGVNFDFTVAKHGIFARSAPVAQVNMMYAGSYETPDITWTDMSLRGHLIATRLYDPQTPGATSTKFIWDAGARLNLKTVDSRNIYFPDIQLLQTTDTIGKGDSNDGGITGTKTFKGTFSHQPIQDGSLVIIDGTPTNYTEKFTEQGGDTLVGSFGGKGSIDRFTGTFTVTFNTAPSLNYSIDATYSYYQTSPTLKAFKPASPATVTPLMLGLVNDSIIKKDGTIVFEDDFNKDLKVDQADANWLVNWTRGYKDGVSTKKAWLLGSIDHSTPAVDVPPGTKPSWYFGTAFSKDEKGVYDTFAKDYKDKVTVVYAGSRNGMLHAFDGGKFQWGDNPQTSFEEFIGYFKWAGNSYTDDIYGTGDELWAFIPINLMGRLKNNYKGKMDQAYVDAAPTVVDVYINGKWTSVLLAAEGDGGNTIFCLDVTEPSPDKVKFLWEYSNPDLMRSKSSPSVAIINKIKTGGDAKWVAFFVSGKSNAAQYPSIYVVDIADGRLLKRIFLNAAEVGTAALGGIPSGQPAVLDFDGDGYIDRLYIGTDKGHLYKVNITGDDNWTVCALNTTVSNPLPIFGTPVVLVDRGYNDSGNLYEGVRIFYGTGDSPYKSDDMNASTIFSFFGFYDGNSNSECTPIKTGPSFQYDLPAGERVWTSAFAAAGRIYFGTSTSDTEDPCDGYGATKAATPHLYVFDSKAGAGTADPLNTIATPNMNIPPLVDDGHLYIRSPDGKITSFGSGVYNNRPAPQFQAQPPRQKTWREVY